ncbi:MAG: trehalose-phosphatase [Candidatus Micrarchaeota archaeon]
MKIVIADFDGTLAAIRRNPKKVKISKKTLAVLEKFHTVGVKVIIISSRPKKFLQKQFPSFVTFLPSRGNTTKINAAHVKLIQKTISNFKWQNGIKLENTAIGIVVHYRKARCVNVNALRTLVEQIAKPVNAKIVNGRKAFEVFSVELNDKKRAVENLLKGVKGSVYFFGDDDSDAEAAEVVLKRGGEAFFINTYERSYTPDGAKKLNGIAHLRKALLQIVKSRDRKKGS